MGSSLNQLAEEEKPLALFTDDFGQSTSPHPQKWMAVVIQPLFWDTSLKGSGEGHPASGQTSSWESGCSLWLKEKWPDIWLQNDYWSMANHFSLATPIIAQCSHGQWPWWQGWRLDMDSETWTHLHSSRPTWLWPSLSTEASNSRDQPLGYHALNASQRPGGRLITMDFFHHGRGNVLFLLE